MTTSSRAALFEKLFKVLRKYYKPVFPDPNAPILDHLLRACCLENASYQAAETALAALFHEFFDLNEIRVSTVRELAEVMACLPDPAAAAQRIKRLLQHVFEENYTFSLEELRKGTQGAAVERLQKIDGVTPFAVAYVVQSALGGHAIPIDSGTMEVLKILDLVSEKDAAAWQVPGLERAIPKSKGIEFGSLLHQLGADFTANPYSPAVHEILLATHSGAKDRLPKRRSPSPPGETEVPAGQPKGESAPVSTTFAAGVAKQESHPVSGEQPPDSLPKKRGRKKKNPVPQPDPSPLSTSSAEAESSTSPSESPSKERKEGSLPSSEPLRPPSSAEASRKTSSESSGKRPEEPTSRSSKHPASTAKLSKKKPR